MEEWQFRPIQKAMYVTMYVNYVNYCVRFPLYQKFFEKLADTTLPIPVSSCLHTYIHPFIYIHTYKHTYIPSYLDKVSGILVACVKSSAGIGSTRTG